MTIQHKSFHFSVKAIDDEQGLIEAYGSVFEVEDQGGDIVRSGAFTRTINNSKARVKSGKATYQAVMLWQHDPNIPIGGWTDLKEDTHGLLCKGQIILTTQQGREAYELIKAGVIQEFSIGYDIPSGGASYDGKAGIRNLTEVRLWEVSPVTFAMNQDALLVGVKSASGKTDWPLADYDTAWTGSDAEKAIFTWAKNDDGEIQSSKAKQGFLYYDPDNSDVQAGYKMPYCIVSGDGLKIVPKGVIACSSVLSGGMGGLKDVSTEDQTAMKAKVKTIYNRINSEQDKELTVPWEQDGKARTVNKEKKTLIEHFNEEMAEDLLEDWQDVYICALSKAVLDAFKIGDTPEADISAALDDFKALVMSKFVAQGMEYSLSQYLTDNAYSSADSTMQNGGQDSYYGYMSNRTRRDRKAMTAGDATTGGFTAAHVDKLHGAAEKANKIMQKHSDALHDAADTITSLVAGTSPKGSHAGGREAKEGRALSSANSQALSDHADALNDLADSTTKSMNRQTKSINSVADDLARVLQGSEAAYGTDPGDAGDAQEGKDSRQRSSYQPRTPAPTPRSSDTDTASEDELAFAMLKLSGLRTA